MGDSGCSKYNITLKLALRQFICLKNQVQYIVQYIVCSLSIGAGVLLLNACLTVREKEPKSHSGKVSHYTCSECMENLVFTLRDGKN